MRDLGALKPEFRLPALAWGSLSMSDLWTGFVLLALPQLPLTFGNAFISITEENNRLFPNRPVTERAVAFSTGLMNLGSSLIGGIPMCHGAGGMAGHVQFGARTGGSSIILGSVLLCAGLFLSSSIVTVFRCFRPASSALSCSWPDCSLPVAGTAARKSRPSWYWRRPPLIWNAARPCCSASWRTRRRSAAGWWI